jgi:hypothetical protein
MRGPCRSDAPATFEAVMIVLHQLARSIPLDPLPGMFKRRGGQRGEPDPFQRLLSRCHLFFPDADDPHRQRLLARSRGVSRWQERHLTKGKLKLGRTPQASMLCKNLERAAGLAGPGSRPRQCITHLFLARLYTPILHGPHQKVRRRRATYLKELEPIGSPILDVDPRTTRFRSQGGLHLTHPAIGFSYFPLAPPVALFSFGGCTAHKGGLTQARKHLPSLRIHGQHRLHEKSTLMTKNTRL